MECASVLFACGHHARAAKVVHAWRARYMCRVEAQRGIIWVVVFVSLHCVGWRGMPLAWRGMA
eukprot:11161793-Lingulodinium_polyedra.AAC.1